MANKGKKYIKLKGGEVATPANLNRARRFMNWYAAYYKVLARTVKTNYSYDVATDAMLLVYDCIAFKGAVVKNFKTYYLQAYFTTTLKARKEKTLHLERTVCIDDEDEAREAYDLPAPDFDYLEYEDKIERISGEIMEHVRAHYDPLAASIFEIYISLQPDMSYKKLAQLLGYSESRVYLEISVIRAECRIKFKRRRDFILSLA